MILRDHGHCCGGGGSLLGSRSIHKQGKQLAEAHAAIMGTNFWHSTHYLYWMKDVTKSDLRKRNPLDRKHLTEDEIDSIHLANIALLEEIGPRLRVRQIIIYTAIVFYRRFYQLQSFVNFDPHLVVGTVFFLASKVEESQLSLPTVASVLHHYTTTGVDEDDAMYTFQEKDILECEFYAIETLQFDLILHHPFPALLQFLDEFELHDECLHLSWQLVQYSYRTDIIMLHPPFMVAYAAAYIACVEAGYNAAQVFANVNIKKELLLKIVREFQDAFDEEKRLYQVQAAALEKLEDIVPDPSADSNTTTTTTTSMVLAQSVLRTNIAHVSRPTTTGAHTHTQYVIRVSDERAPGMHWTVYRRYSEFRALKVKLEEATQRDDLCAHCAIMAKRTCFVQFPRRRLFSSLKEQVLEDRRLGLNVFLDAVTKHARTCKAREVCQTRPLMDQFLMVSDMRYTYLDVNLDVREETDVQRKEMLASPVHHGGAVGRALCPVRSLSSNNQLEDALEQPPKSRGDPSEDQTNVVTARRRCPSDHDNDRRVLSSKVNNVPQLLSYDRASRSSRNSRNSFNEREREPSYRAAPSSNSRHSDPGTSAPSAHRIELLNFTRNSYTDGVSGRRTDTRYRPRKVHLSSAAKRIKRKEEEEARLSSRQIGHKKKLVPMTPIAEEPTGSNQAETGRPASIWRRNHTNAP
ncbi:TPA: hypothetical protein N0F65_002847 [Lagenidium giganteum]|uniref:PX domain-containing protein n=1 Tax=Lagenidium giganteum TaxID=4803 RepID=A0AAV2ZDE1_9STRA|nr:TPA: hypothetical protein N0F65_002847 [Lagenidium giganteum]